MKRLIIVGSPRTNGRSAHLAEMLFEANIDEHPEDELFLVPVSEVEVGPCIGCDACQKKSGVIVKDDDGQEVTLQKHRCVFDDDMQTLYDLIDDAEEVTVVSPVYFSGAPAPMKCVLDRLQPYFWARMELRESGEELPEKRPLTLHVLGEGGDPHGFDALISEVGSAFAVANFRLERVLDWVGKIDEAGEITAEATELVMPVAPTPASKAKSEPESLAGVERSEGAVGGESQGTTQVISEAAGSRQQKAVKQRSKPRPKLDLHSTMRNDSRSQAEEPHRGQKRQGSKQGRSSSSPKSSSAKKRQGKRRG